MSKTIMLVHGAWVTADCWASFRSFFEAKGYRVVVPPWPYPNIRREIEPRHAAHGKIQRNENGNHRQKRWHARVVAPD